MEVFMGMLYVSQKSKWSAKKGVKPYAAAKRLSPHMQGSYIPSAPLVRRESPNVPSLYTTGYSVCAKKEDKVYTGSNIVGIGTMHKSNAVPIFNNNEARDIASMRRN
jgi:predicted small secreted protein